MSNPFSTLFAKLTLDELTALSTAADPALNALATGDGSTTSILGAGLALQGAVVTNSSLFQKIGVNDLATALIAAKAAAIASATTALNPNPATPSA